MLAEHNEFIAELATSLRAAGLSPVAVGGSDAHILRYVGTTYTEAPGRTREEFLANLLEGRTQVGGAHGGRQRLLVEIYGSIANHWRGLLGLERHEISSAERLGSIVCSALLLPFQFVPGVIALAHEARSERGAIERYRRVWADDAERAPAGDRISAALTVARRRVAITGIGMVSALGVGRERVWQNLVDGRCGIGRVTLFDTAGYRSQLAAEIARLSSRRVTSRRSNSVAGRVAIRSPSWPRVRRSQDAGLDAGPSNPRAYRRDARRRDERSAAQRGVPGRGRGEGRGARDAVEDLQLLFEHARRCREHALRPARGRATASSRPVRRARSRSATPPTPSGPARSTRRWPAAPTCCAG